jgi:hypothetical protein
MLRWIEGYEPLPNYQQLLRDVVEAAVTLRGVKTLQPTSKKLDLSRVFVKPPVSSGKRLRAESTPPLKIPDRALLASVTIE